MIKDEDKALILLSSLLNEEYETTVITLINGKKSLSNSEASAAPVNYELRKQDKEFSISTSAEVLTASRIGYNHRKGKEILVKMIIVN